jgi:hypothetical protein
MDEQVKKSAKSKNLQAWVDWRVLAGATRALADNGVSSSNYSDLVNRFLEVLTSGLKGQPFASIESAMSYMEESGYKVNRDTKNGSTESRRLLTALQFEQQTELQSSLSESTDFYVPPSVSPKQLKQDLEIAREIEEQGEDPERLEYEALLSKVINNESFTDMEEADRFMKLKNQFNRAEKLKKEEADDTSNISR